MELRQLEYFEAVCRLKNFTRAAEELHVTQPTVTTAVKNLEKELGALLLDRDNGGMALTAAGEAVLIRAQIIMRNVEKIYQKTADAGAYSRQEISIGIPPISCACMYPLILGKFAAAHPNIDVQVLDCCNHETIHKLLRDELEMGFIILPEEPRDGLEFLPLESGSLMALLSDRHPLAQKASVTLEELAQETIFMYEKGTSYVEVRLEKEFADRGLSLPIHNYFANFSTIYDLVSQNFGISFTMPTTSPILSELSGLATLPFEEPLNYEIGLAWGKNKFLSSGCRELIRFICDTYQTQPRPGQAGRRP